MSSVWLMGWKEWNEWMFCGSVAERQNFMSRASRISVGVIGSLIKVVHSSILNDKIVNTFFTFISFHHRILHFCQ